MKHISENLGKYKKMVEDHDREVINRTLDNLVSVMNTQHEQISELRTKCERILEKLELLEDAIV